MMRTRQASFLILSTILLFGIPAKAEQTLPKLPVPGQLTLLNEPTVLKPVDGGFVMGAAKNTNLFNSPSGTGIYEGAPMLLFSPSDTFTMTARIEAQLIKVYDVAALVIYADRYHWAKLCYEYSVEQEPTVVSVVTRELSDDCNGEVINADYVYYAICRKGNEYSFHWSADGKKWRLVRHFNLDCEQAPRVGFAVHKVWGDDLNAMFSEIHYWNQAPDNMRRLDTSSFGEPELQ